MIRREEQRLRRTFRRLLLLSLASPAALQACSSSSNTPGPGEDAGPDATMGSDATADAGSDQTVGPDGGDAGDARNDAPIDGASCQPSQPYFNDASYYQMLDSAADSPYFPCYYFVDFPCGTTYQTGTGATACFLYLNECVNICTLDGGFVDCLYWQDAGCEEGGLTAEAGQPATIGCGQCNGVGRRPSGLCSARRRPAKTALGAYFAAAAHLEAASVHAFRRLGEELRTHGAPRELIRVADRSARDEVRHARVTARLARRFGGAAASPRVRRSGVRKLEAIALENAVEGCVRETFGAMVATWQAAHARDEEVRRSMTRIAEDETRHAALAWAVAEWAEARLGPQSRARLAAARRYAVRSLEAELSVEPPSEVVVRAGLPGKRDALALLAAMTEQIWA